MELEKIYNKLSYLQKNIDSNWNKLSNDDKSNIISNLFLFRNLGGLSYNPRYISNNGHINTREYLYVTLKNNKVPVSKNNLNIEISNMKKEIKYKLSKKPVENLNINEIKVSLLNNIVSENTYDIKNLVKYFKKYIKIEKWLYRGIGLEFSDFEKIKIGTRLKQNYSFTMDKRTAEDFAYDNMLSKEDGVEVLIEVDNMYCIKILDMLSDVEDTKEFIKSSNADNIQAYAESESEFICLDKELIVYEIVEIDDYYYILKCKTK